MVTPDRQTGSLIPFKTISPTPTGQSSVGCALLEHDGRIVSVTRSFARMVGCGVKPLFGQSVFDALMLAPETHRLSLLSEGSTIPVRARLNGRPLCWNVHKIAPGAALSGYYIGLLCEDNSRESSEPHFTRNNHTASLGGITATVAHEIAGPLNVIANTAELLLEENAVDQDTRHFLLIMRDEAQRLGILLQDLLSLNRELNLKTSAQDCAAVVHSVMELFYHQCASKHINLRVKAEPNLPPVAADAARLRQVFFNLIKNACDASPSRSEVRIDLRSAKLEKNQPAVEIVIRDRGEGIEPDNLKHVCTPFFSTKGSGLGTGLGLTVVQQIVSAHRGEFRIISKVGEGTQASVLLPVFKSENGSNETRH